MISHSLSRTRTVTERSTLNHDSLLPHSQIHSLPQPLTLTPSLTHSHMHSLPQPFTHSHLHSLLPSLSHTCTHSLTHSLTYAPTPSTIHSLTHTALTPSLTLSHMRSRVFCCRSPIHDHAGSECWARVLQGSALERTYKCVPVCVCMRCSIICVCALLCVYSVLRCVCVCEYLSECCVCVCAGP